MRWVRDDLPVTVDDAAAYERRNDPTAERTPDVRVHPPRRRAVAVERPFAIRIEEHDVGVRPGRDGSLRGQSPKRLAGFAARRQAMKPAALRTSSASPARRAASVKVTGSKDCTPATPPHAAKMSRVPRALRSGVHGE